MDLRGHNKSPGMLAMLKSMSSFPQAWEGELICAKCGADIIDFKDEVSRKEYIVSKMCQACQDRSFSGRG